MNLMQRCSVVPLLVTLLAGGVGLTGCASDRMVIDQANDVHNGLEPAVITDPELTQYIQAMGDRIIAAARTLDQTEYGPKSHRNEDPAWMFSQSMQFHFVNSKTLNAFTTGGEHMYIYTELFRQCGTEDELAAVMAHEYGHVYARHVHKGVNRQYGIIGASVAAGLAGAAIGGKERAATYGPAFAGAALSAGQFVGMGYTREDEAEADMLGFDFYTSAGWDPNRFDDFFQHMVDQGYDKTPEFMSDHPSLSSRVEAARQRAAALPPEAANWRKPPVADAARFRQLQARSTALAESMPSDASLEGAQTLLASFSNCITPTDQPGQARARAIVLGRDERHDRGRDR